MSKKKITLAERFRELRNQAGLSLRSLEEATGVDRSVISRIESGESAKPKPETLRRLAEAMQADPDDLYKAAGWTSAEYLPGFRPYLRTKYGHLPDDKLAELEAIFDEIANEYDND